MTQFAVLMAKRAEFHAYDVWNSELEKARMKVVQVRKKRNACFHLYKASPHSAESRQKAISAEQELWKAETEYASLLLKSKKEIENIFLSTLHGYHAPIGPRDIPDE